MHEMFYQRTKLGSYKICQSIWRGSLVLDMYNVQYMYTCTTLVMILPLPKKRVEIVSYIVHLHVHVCLLKNVNSLKIYMHDFIIHLCCRTLNMCVSCCVVRSCSVAYIPVRRLATVDTVSLAGSTVSLYYVSFVV